MHKKTHTIIILAVILLTACQVQTKKNTLSISSEYSLPIDTAFVPTDSNQFYFPLVVLTDTASYIGRDTFIGSWYSKHLFAMQEPIFYADKTAREIYRFTWLRTFHSPVAIRIEKQDNNYTLYWKSCDGAGGYDPGNLVIDKKKVIDQATWNKFKMQLTKINFWNMKTTEEVFGNDGSQWILEGKEMKKYHVVDRWTPGESSNYYQCCDFLIKLTDLKIPYRDKY